MSNVVKVKVVEDDSVTRALNKFADKLKGKYTKKRKVNEALLRKKTPFERVVGVIVNVLSTLVFGFAIIFCFSTVYSKLNNMPPSVAGYFCMRVSSGSMINSGFNIGRNVIVHSVDTKTLKPDDIIAFYVDYSHYESETTGGQLTLKPVDEIGSTKYELSFAGFFGVQSERIRESAKNDDLLVFHHIRAVWEDDAGHRYFTTYGSSNTYADGETVTDVWLVDENLVVGIFDDSNLANAVSVGLNAVSSPIGVFIILLIPMLALIYSLIMRALRNVQCAMLENDVIEEKRKLTDPICVKNEIGYKMGKEAKYKVLAQAEDEQKLEYINLLWKTNDRPEAIRKYYLRKDLIIKPMQKLRDVNRQCEQMFKDNVQPAKIAKFYQEEKKKIEEEEKRYKRLLKEVHKTNEALRQEKDKEGEQNVKSKEAGKPLAEKPNKTARTSTNTSTGATAKTAEKPSANSTKANAKPSVKTSTGASKKPLTKVSTSAKSKTSAKTGENSAKTGTVAKKTSSKKAGGKASANK